MPRNASSPQNPTTPQRSTITKRLAAAAGAVGAATAATSSEAAVVYVPTSGVVAAQGIPGFSFSAPTNVTSGTLRPPSTPGNTLWDIDGAGGTDFFLQHVTNNGGNSVLGSFLPAATNAPRGLVTNSSRIQPQNTNPAAIIGPSLNWQTEVQPMSQLILSPYYRYNRQPDFPTGVAKQFAFRFPTPDTLGYYYGWGTLTIDLSNPGSGYKISEAFYQSTPGTSISVGAVPVPEPTGLALLALGAVGVAAWRAKQRS